MPKVLYLRLFPWLIIVVPRCHHHHGAVAFVNYSLPSCTCRSAGRRPLLERPRKGPGQQWRPGWTASAYAMGAGTQLQRSERSRARRLFFPSSLSANSRTACSPPHRCRCCDRGGRLTMMRILAYDGDELPDLRYHAAFWDALRLSD
jgi:hypothetical protein